MKTGFWTLMGLWRLADGARSQCSLTAGYEGQKRLGDNGSTAGSINAEGYWRSVIASRLGAEGMHISIRKRKEIRHVLDTVPL